MSDLPETVVEGSHPTEPGWYFDPEGRYAHQAYWDGEKWTGETRRGRKEARKARERSFHRSWLTVGLVLGFVGLFNWWWGSPAEMAADRRAELSTEHLLADNGITFTTPEGWTEMIWEQPDPPVWRYAVTPDHLSSWILLTYTPDPDLREYASAEDVDQVVADYQNSSMWITEGPDPVQHGRLGGYELTIGGIIGQDTGKHLGGKVVLLYDPSVTYRFDAQWDTEHEAEVAAALDHILSSLQTQPDD
ncbi:MAG: DUF2510 domain-containing protein [Acidimicrobiia bacterium]|jgi:hypothetical protein